MEKRIASGVAVQVVWLGSPCMAHASDMGPVGPCMFLPIDLLGALAFLLLGLAARTGDTSARSPTILYLLGLLFGVPGLVIAFTAFDHLLSGSHTVVAALSLAAFAVLVSAFVFARNAVRRPGFDLD